MPIIPLNNRQRTLADIAPVACSCIISSISADEAALGNCPQAALAEYPQIVKKTLGYADDTMLICGIALGYEDSNAAVNQYRTARAEVGEFTRFFD